MTEITEEYALSFLSELRARRERGFAIEAAIKRLPVQAVADEKAILIKDGAWATVTKVAIDGQTPSESDREYAIRSTADICARDDKWPTAAFEFVEPGWLAFVVEGAPTPLPA